MSIDRIGKPSVPDLSGITPGGTQRVGSAGQTTGESFKVSAPARTEPQSALERLQAGEIDLPQYLDIKVAHATEHLVDRLNPEQLNFIRSHLRDQLSSDPGLLDLVRAASGSVPASQE